MVARVCVQCVLDCHPFLNPPLGLGVKFGEVPDLWLVRCFVDDCITESGLLLDGGSLRWCSKKGILSSC